MQRADLVSLFAELRTSEPVIVGPGTTSGALYQADHRAPTIYNMDMGYATAICLGLALAVPDEQVVALEGEIRLVRTAAGELAGRQLAAARIRERTDCSIVAVERGEEVILEFGADFEVGEKDALYITGSSEHIDRFFEAFPGTHG